jgi:DNA adenine methylase
MRTFIKWQGNKSKHINKFIKYIPNEYNTYIEPFVGSGSLLLKLEPDKWIINDLNKDLIHIWKCIKNDPEEIIKKLKEYSIHLKKLSKENKIKYCKEISNKIEKIPYNIEYASLYLLIILCSYMGFLSTNMKFKSLSTEISNNNFPFNKTQFFDNIINISSFLNNTNGKIYNKDYKDILEKTKEGDFVFLDPPYMIMDLIIIKKKFLIIFS